MSEVDYLVADLVGAVLGDGHDAALAAWGRSGDALLGELTKAEAQDPGVRALRDEYKRLYTQRNALVHGMFERSSAEDPGQHDVVRLVRSTKKTPSQFETERQTWDRADLRNLLSDADDLKTCALVMIGQHRQRA